MDGHPKADPFPRNICSESPHRTGRDANEEGEEGRVERRSVLSVVNNVNSPIKNIVRDHM